MSGIATASQNGLPEVHIVRSQWGGGKRGFFLARSGSLLDNPKFWAHYNDGVVEELTPPTGQPRPVPDLADRSKGVGIPASMRSAPMPKFVTGSLFSGQMRRMVQCQFINGNENKFSYVHSKTHGLFEWPPKIIGKDSGQEAVLAAKRTYYIIEISSAGVFAAPIKMGSTSFGVPSLSDYLPTLDQLRANPGLSTVYDSLTLSWAYVNRNESRKIKKLIDSDVMGAFYSAKGGPWHGDTGWAFNYSGTRASNVTVITHSEGVDVDTFPNYYETYLSHVSFSATYPTAQTAYIELLNPTRAKVTAFSHGIIENGVAFVQGCSQEDYNGTHIAINVTSNTFEFNLVANPLLTSPATPKVDETIKIVGAGDAVEITATLTTPETGKVTFQRGSGVLWVPGASTSQWDAIPPFRYKTNCNGPIHIYYDGEIPMVTRWLIANTPASSSTVVTTRTAGPIDHRNAICQSPGGRDVDSAPSGENTNISTINRGSATVGFYGGFDHTVSTYSRDIRSSIESSTGQEEEPSSVAGNHYSLDPSCYFEVTQDDGHGNIITSTITECSQSFRNTVTNETTVAVDRSGSESKSATSWGVIFPTEREAFMALSGFVEEHSFSVATTPGHRRMKVKEESLNLPSPYGWTCPGTTLEYPVFAGSLSTGPTVGSSDSGSSHGGHYSVKASGGFVIEQPLGESNPKLSSFMSWNADTKTIAESSAFMMRGGLYYDDPTMAPKNQKSNTYFSIDEVTLLSPPNVGFSVGFTQLTGGAVTKFPVGFVGVV